jgi:hypothetical protein
LKDQPLIFDDF